MGIVAEFNNDEFNKAIELVRYAANRVSIPCGIHIVSPSAGELRKRIHEGYRFIAYSIDAVFFNNAIVNPFHTQTKK